MPQQLISSGCMFNRSIYNENDSYSNTPEVLKKFRQINGLQIDQVTRLKGRSKIEQCIHFRPISTKIDNQFGINVIMK